MKMTLRLLVLSLNGAMMKTSGGGNESRLKTINIKRFLGGNPIQPKLWRSHQRRFAFSNSILSLIHI